MTTIKSMTDTAYEALSKKKKAVPFFNLWSSVQKTTGVSDEMVAQFYTDLSLDSRFVSLEGNKWDLRERRTYSESHVDIDYIEDDEIEEEISEDDIDAQIIAEENEENY